MNDFITKCTYIQSTNRTQSSKPRVRIALIYPEEESIGGREIQDFNTLKIKSQGRAVDPQTPEHSGVEVSTPELFWGWILFWD